LVDISGTQTASDATIRLQIPGVPKLSCHSITAISDDKFCIFGGTSSDERPNTTLYIVNIENLTVEAIDTEFQNFGFRSHGAAYLYERLFVFGGEHQLVWFFDFSHRLWIPFVVRQSAQRQHLVPIFIFTSQRLSQNRALHMIERSLTHIVRFPILQEPLQGSINNHPHFVAFLYERLQEALEYFKTLKPVFSVDLTMELIKIKTVKNSILNQPKAQAVLPEDLGRRRILETVSVLDRVSSCRRLAGKITRIVQSQAPPAPLTVRLSQTEIIPKQNLSVRKILRDLVEVRSSLRAEIEALEMENTALVNDIECAGFVAFSVDFPAKFAGKEKSVRSDEELADRSWGLAREIQFLREQLAEVNNQVIEARAQKDDTELFLQNQLWSILSRTAKLKDTLNDGRVALCNQFAEFVARRVQVLRQHSNEAYIRARELAEAHSKRESRRLLLVRLNEIRSTFRSAVAEMDPSKLTKVSSANDKIQKLMRELGNFNTWMIEARKVASSREVIGNVARRSIGRRTVQSVRLDKGREPVLAPSPVIDPDEEFLNEIERRLKQFDDRLDFLSRLPQ
jgi:hypothetical protein